MSERRSHLILVALIGIALIGAALLAIPASPLHQATRLGLDLQGGLEIVLKAQPEKDQPLRESDVNRSLEIIRNRVDKLGVAEPTITKQGTDQISVELPGVKNLETAKTIIGKTAELELYDLQPAAVGPSASATRRFPPSRPSRSTTSSPRRRRSRCAATTRRRTGPTTSSSARGRSSSPAPRRRRRRCCASVTERCRKARVSSPCRPTP